MNFYLQEIYTEICVNEMIECPRLSSVTQDRGKWVKVGIHETRLATNCWKLADD